MGRTALGGIEIGLIALLSSYDHISFPAGVIRLLDAVVFNALIGDNDAHGKNF